MKDRITCPINDSPIQRELNKTRIGFVIGQGSWSHWLKKKATGVTQTEKPAQDQEE